MQKNVLFLNIINLTRSMSRYGITVIKLILALSFLSLSACSEYLKGKPFKASFIEIKSDGKLACLDSVPDDLQNFLDSAASDQQIDKAMNCINETLTEFQTKVQGRSEATSFTSAEVYDIFTTFAKKTNLTQSAAKNLISLKSALFGGDASKITKSEIDSLKKYLEIVKIEAKKLKPYIKLFYFESSNKAVTLNFINEAVNQLNLSIKNLYKASQLVNSNYSFDDFKTLVINLLNLGTDKQLMLEVAQKLNILLNGNEAVLVETDRMSYIDNITEALKLFAQYKNGYAQFEITSSADLNNTITFVESVIKLIENSLQYKKTSALSVSSIDNLVSSIAKTNLLGFQIPAYTMAMFYLTILVRVFEGGANANVLAFNGLKPYHLKNIKLELGIYKVYSKLIERISSEDLFVAQGITSAPINELQRSMQILNIQNETEILSKYDATTQLQIINNVNELRSEFISSHPVIYKNKKIAIAVNQQAWTQSWKDLARGLYVKMLARLVMQGWGAIYPLENIEVNSINEVAMAKWYSEVKNFGIAIKGFDSRTVNSGAGSVKAGNLFTHSGNGDTKLNFKELTENLGVLLSGSITANEIKNDLEISKCNMPELDVFENHWNFESCLYPLLKNNYKRYFASSPHLIQYLDSLTAEQFNNYFQSIIDVVRNEVQNKNNKIETSDLRGLTTLLQYIEGLYLVHDVNQNFMLSEAEIKAGYAKFQIVATDYANKNSRSQIDEFNSWRGDVAGYRCFSEQDLIRESFVYLIFNGRTPEQSDLNNFPCFRGLQLLDFTGEVSRKSAVSAMNSLKDILK